MSHIENILIQAIKDAVDKVYHLKDIDSLVMVEIPKDQTKGDYSTNISMRLAKQLKMKPIDIANSLVNELKCESVDKIEVAMPGFINFWMKKDALADVINLVLDADEHYGEDRQKCGYYYYLKYVPETVLLFRSFQYGTPLAYDGLQVYKNQLLVAEYQVPKGFRVIGYVPPYYYAEGKPDIDKEAMVFYRFKLPF